MGVGYMRGLRDGLGLLLLSLIGGPVLPASWWVDQVRVLLCQAGAAALEGVAIHVARLAVHGGSVDLAVAHPVATVSAAGAPADVSGVHFGLAFISASAS